MDIFKLLKTLNSAQASWQVTLAIILGMISGFLPLTTPLNFLILFIAFTINIPLVIFFFMSAVFATLALFLDPLFASLGYTVLNEPSLVPLFTDMYNSTPLLWTSYNYTILMGSALVSFILAGPMFFVINIFINKYRDVLEAKFKNSKYFSWLNPYTEEKVAKKPGLLRLWAGALFLVLIGLLVAIAILLVDPLVKFTLEYTLSKASSRTIYINNVKSDLLTTSLKINGISILSKNNEQGDDITIDTVTIKLNLEHLLAKKLDFEIISFGNINFKESVKRRDGVHITQRVDESVQSGVESSKAGLTSAKKTVLPNVDKLINKEGLASVKKAKEIKHNILAIETKWRETIKGEEQKQDIKMIKQKIKELRQQAKSVKNLEQITKILADADRLKKQIKASQKKVKQLSKDYTIDKKLITEYMKDIKKLPLEDYKKLKDKYSLDQNGAMNLIGTHFSSRLEEYLRMGSKYYAYVEPYISSDEEEEAEEKPKERLKGQWIKYVNVLPYPDFVIRKLKANIIRNGYEFNTKIQDISNEQKLYNKPLLAHIKSTNKDYKLLDIYIKHNNLNQERITTIKSSLKEYKLQDYNAVAKLTIQKSSIDAKALTTITDFTNITSSMAANFTKTNLVYDAKNSTDKRIKAILDDINSFTIAASLKGTLKKPQISLHSDLDKKILTGVKKQLNKEVRKYKTQLKLAINKAFKEELGDINLSEFVEIEKLINTASKESSSLDTLLDKYVSKKAMQKKISKNLINKYGSKLKFF